MMKIKKADTVLISAGKDRGKTGKVLRVLAGSEKVFVDGITRKRHKRSRAQGKKGEIIHIPFPLSIASIKLICPKCGKATRVGFDASGEKKVRICKKCQAHIE